MPYKIFKKNCRCIKGKRVNKKEVKIKKTKKEKKKKEEDYYLLLIFFIINYKRTIKLA